MAEQEQKPRKMYYAYTEAQRGGQKFDIRIGTAFETKDGIVVQLDAVPINGRLYLKKATD